MKLEAIKKINPLTYLKIPYDRIKASDTQSEMIVELYYMDDLADVNGLSYFRLTRDNLTYTEVEDFTVSNGVVRFKFPMVYSGRYYIEIKDIEGKLYTSKDEEYFDVVKSLGETMHIQYNNIVEMVVRDITHEVVDFIHEHSSEFRGPKGEKGDKGDRGLRGVPGIDGAPGPPGADGQAQIPVFELDDDGNLYYYSEEEV